MSHSIKLPIAIPADIREEFLKRLPYIAEGFRDFGLSKEGTEVSYSQDRLTVATSEIAQRVVEVANKLLAGHRFNQSKTLYSTSPKAFGFNIDPHLLLENEGQLVRFGLGRYGFGPKVIRLIQAFDNHILELATDFKTRQYSFPSLIGADVLSRCRYIANFPSSLNLVSHLREDLGLIQEFARGVTCDEQGKLDFNPQAISRVDCLLSPSVCFHWYQWLHEQHLSELSSITAIGKCFRYESSNLVGLERLWDFNMRELIFVGPGEQVLERRDKCLKLAIDILNSLEMGFEVSTATDPFFIDTYAIQTAFQQGFELKHEILVTLPYNQKKLAVGSVNYHQDFFGRSFDIGTENGPAHTACIGFGLERLALAFFSQHGVEESKWPASVCKLIG